MCPQMTDFETIRRFVFAGRAIMTLEFVTSGNWYTYQIRAMKPSQNRRRIEKGKSPSQVTHFVGARMGGGERYTYIGYYKHGKYYFHTEGGVNRHAPAVMAWKWFDQYLARRVKAPHRNLRVYHAGKCARCGRTLTSPESINKGIGSECERRL